MLQGHQDIPFLVHGAILTLSTARFQDRDSIPLVLDDFIVTFSRQCLLDSTARLISEELIHLEETIERDLLIGMTHLTVEHQSRWLILGSAWSAGHGIREGNERRRHERLRVQIVLQDIALHGTDHVHHRSMPHVGTTPTTIMSGGTPRFGPGLHLNMAHSGAETQPGKAADDEVAHHVEKTFQDLEHVARHAQQCHAVLMFLADVQKSKVEEESQSVRHQEAEDEDQQPDDSHPGHVVPYNQGEIENDVRDETAYQPRRAETRLSKLAIEIVVGRV
mmetsp:Transcript_37097/g.98831  ORF Transcript_37097/g.98831 Transcript_37097/m.98831 type:complete len:277 (+) Transcript_37097:790-1620(+)